MTVARRLSTRFARSGRPRARAPGPRPGPASRGRKRPKTLQQFEEQFPTAWNRYVALREACDRFGPLDAKTRELIKIGMEVARRRHGGLLAHIDRAKAAGATVQEISHAILLALPLLGLPDVLDAFVVAKKRLG